MSLAFFVDLWNLLQPEGGGGGGGGAASGGGGAGGGGLGGCGGANASTINFVMIGAMFVAFYFLLIRPQRKKQQEHESFLKSLKKGDRVVTNSGLYGTIVALADKDLTIEIAPRVNVKLLRSSIAGRQDESSSASADADKAKDDKAKEEKSADAKAKDKKEGESA